MKNLRLDIEINNDGERELTEVDSLLKEYHSNGTTKLGNNPLRRTYHVLRVKDENVGVIVGAISQIKGLEKLSLEFYQF